MFERESEKKMSAELMYSLSDENPDFQKRIGCMNVLFHHFLGSPRVATPNHETLPPGSNGKHRTEAKIASPRRKENNPKNTVKEKQRLSFESPRSSLSSSSCSSSYSSADCTETSRLDQHRSSLSQTSFREIPKQEISNDQSMVSLQPSQHSVNLRNVVKDCINRESRRLSVKTATKVDVGQNRTLKYIDSPRPWQSPKPAMTGLSKSSHDVSKLREMPKTPNECKVGSLDFGPRDARRFSYDERGSHGAVKVKLKDQQRLSLDSREISMKGSYSVVAKLMGLEILPDPMLIDGNQYFRIKNSQDLKDDPRSLSSRIDENKKTQVSCSPRNSTKEPIPPHSTNANSEKHIATRYPDQPVPWNLRTPPTAPNSSLTVYGEIKKRLAELEFQKSGKDLRGLKQILEAKQKSKQRLETRKDDQASNFVSHTNSNIGQSSKAPNLRKLQSSNTVSAIVKGTGSPTPHKSPVKIIKPAICMENASNSSSLVVATRSLRRIRTSSSPADARIEKLDKQSYKELALRPGSPKGLSERQQSRDKTTSGTLSIKATLKELSPIARENKRLAMSSETTCLKLQQKKLELEKQPRRACPVSDKSRSRRQSSRLQAEPGLPHWKSRHKCHNSQCSDDQISDINCDMRDLSHQGDASLIKFERNTSVATYGAIGVTSTDRSYKIEGPVFQKHEKNHKFPTTEPSSTVMEQPSPISVLDATFYEDGSPSPVKKKSNAFKDYEGLIADDAEWSPIGLNDKQLIFDDAVKEILVRKLEKESSYKTWVSTNMVEDKIPKSHQVVRDLCSDIDKLRTASDISLYDEVDSQQSMSLGDLMLGSMDWSKCKSGIQGVVLDVERLIFKDLICEVISSEAANPQG